MSMFSFENPEQETPPTRVKEIDGGSGGVPEQYLFELLSKYRTEQAPATPELLWTG